MKILITGGAGFVGTNLVNQLAPLGHDLVVYDNLKSTNGLLYLDNPPYQLIEGDINDGESLKAAMADVDACIHLAAAGSVVDSVSDPVDNFQNNVMGTFSVLNAARSVELKKLVFASTGGAIIGDVNPPVNEETYPAPISPYGASKLCCESYCRAFSRSYGLNIVSLRFANVIGPYSLHKKGVLTNFIKASLEGNPVTIFGDGSATRDYLFAEDLCDGIIRGLMYEEAGFDYFHLAGGRETSISGLLDIVNSVTDNDKLVATYAPKRTGEVERNFAQYAKAADKLGFSPRHSIQDAVKKTYKWYEEMHVVA